MEEDVRQDATGHPSSGATTRVSVQAAAERLGTTVDAIRKRVQRDTIAHEKDSAGRVWILLDTDRPRHDEAGQSQDVRGDELVGELREQVAYLRDQLDQEREARTEERRRHDTIIAQLSQANAALASRVPELEPPRDPRAEAPEPRESPETVTEGRGGGTAPDESEGQHHPVERPSWWRKFFGFE